VTAPRPAFALRPRAGSGTSMPDGHHLFALRPGARGQCLLPVTHESTELGATQPEPREAVMPRTRRPFPPGRLSFLRRPPFFGQPLAFRRPPVLGHPPALHRPPFVRHPVPGFRSLCTEQSVPSHRGPGFPATVIALVAALSNLVPTGGHAQTPGALPVALQLPASTRAMGLGDAYMMDSGHSDAVFYHPALLTRSSGFGLAFQRWGPEATAAAASAAVEWLGGGVGVGLRTLQYGAASGGVLAAPGGQDHLFDFGSEPVSEMIATLAYARDIFADLSLGVAVDLVNERVGADRNAVTLFDVGVTRDFGPVVAGLTVHDIGEKPIVDSGSEPARITLGVGAYGRPLGPLDVGFAASLGLDDDEVTYGGGVEVGYWPIQGRTFVARFGFEDVPDRSDARHFTTGFAFWGDELIVEWAFRPFGDADEGGTHRFGVGWR